MTGRALRSVATIPLVVLAFGGCGSTGDGAGPGTPETTTSIERPAETRPATETSAPRMEHGGPVDPGLLAPAFLGAAAFQDVAAAEAAGWSSTIDTLGCFENPQEGGMGVHWLNEALLDADLDPARPEALVYELDADGEVVGLVGHEYLVPVEAWVSDAPPNLFGVDFHQHSVLPFWVLHVYLWKDNPSGMFNDWNPAVRLCPDGVTVFGSALAQEQARPPAGPRTQQK